MFFSKPKKKLDPTINSSSHQQSQAINSQQTNKPAQQSKNAGNIPNQTPQPSNNTQSKIISQETAVPQNQPQHLKKDTANIETKKLQNISQDSQKLRRNNIHEHEDSSPFAPVQDVVQFFTKDPQKDKILASTQDHLDIYDLKDNLVLLKNGDVALVIETTAVNFQLLSSYEQDLKISAFTELINSLNFELQIVIHTEPIDMKKYIKFLNVHYNKQSDFAIRKYMKSYIEFVKDLVIENNVLQKRFFVVIPHKSGLITAQDVNPASKMIDFVLGRKRILEIKNADKLLEKALTKLIPKRDHIMKMLSKMGLGSKQLNNKELINLFYSYYNDPERF